MVKVAFSLLAGAATAAPEADFVPTLPGYGVPPSPQWSGYLDASAEEPGTMLHYWFAAAESQQDTAPVVLWLNGGPGSSSVLGMLEEHGPLVMNATGGLMQNPYAWTKQANLLILESPAGVGYSYCAAMETGGSCHNTDVTTAKAARAALQDFFANKFPELRSLPFFITGESYAGVYVPTLAEEILNKAQEVNLQGLAVGDPCTDNDAQAESMDMLWYSHKYGLLPDADFDLLYHNCSYRHPSLLSQSEWLREEDSRWAAPAMTRLGGPVLDAKQEQACKVAHRVYLLTTSRGISQSWSKAYINELDLYNDASPFNFESPGNINYDVAQWMMREDVQKALHVTSGPTREWPGPPSGWRYTKVYHACHAAPAGTDSMVNFYRRIAPQLKTTIVFNGDTDPCVTYEGTRTAIERVNFQVLPGGRYRPWFYNKTAASLETLRAKPALFGTNLGAREAGPQFGGHVVDYENGLSFLTVHGAGHMVPQFRPQAAERLLGRLLSGDPFAPLLPTDDELAAMSEIDFASALNAWTDSAKASVDDHASALVV